MRQSCGKKSSVQARLLRHEALKRGIDHQTIYNITKIDWWFLDKMQHLANLENGLKKCHGTLSEAQYKRGQEVRLPGQDHQAPGRPARGKLPPASRWWIPARRSSPPTPTSTRRMTATTKPLSSLPKKRPRPLQMASPKESAGLWFRPHPHWSGASSLTTARSTASGRAEKARL